VRAFIRLRMCALPCEMNQAKLDFVSRLARSTLLSKILTTLRLSGAVWIELPTKVGILELVALESLSSVTLPRFLLARHF